ncbi:hypothetical protein BDR04DRAFT_1024116 [Suillus decipiens]|nr:hypothetical protein BDR04DRAFT_1024116 [Suillus decipiens]
MLQLQDFSTFPSLILGRQHSTCPLTALVYHLESNLNIPSHAPLFSFETATVSWSPMTKPWFLSRCNEVWVAAGHASMPEHAFHIGGATELLLRSPNTTHSDLIFNTYSNLTFTHKAELPDSSDSFFFMQV